jgi:hypothetical protein
MDQGNLQTKEQATTTKASSPAPAVTRPLSARELHRALHKLRAKPRFPAREKNESAWAESFGSKLKCGSHRAEPELARVQAYQLPWEQVKYNQVPSNCLMILTKATCKLTYKNKLQPPWLVVLGSSHTSSLQMSWNLEHDSPFCEEFFVMFAIFQL